MDKKDTRNSVEKYKDIMWLEGVIFKNENKKLSVIFST